MKITSTHRQNLEKAVVALTNFLNLDKYQSGDDKQSIVIAPYHQSLYSFSYLMNWYKANSYRNAPAQAKAEYDQLFVQYLLSLDLSQDQVQELKTNYKRQYGEQKEYTDLEKQVMKKHLHVFVSVLTDHYKKLLKKYEAFDEEGVALTLVSTISKSEEHLMTGLTANKRKLSIK